MSPQELAAIVARDAAMHPSIWDSFDMIERVGGDIGEGNRAVRDRRALIALLRETREALADAQLSFADKGFGPTVSARELANYRKAMKRVRRALAALGPP